MSSHLHKGHHGPNTPEATQRMPLGPSRLFCQNTGLRQVPSILRTPGRWREVEGWSRALSPWVWAHILALGPGSAPSYQLRDKG